MILVTGATGSNGGAVLGELRARGVAIRALVHRPEQVEQMRGRGVEAVAGDFLNPASLDAALAGVDQAFLVCASTPQQEQMETNFVEAAERAGGVRHVVKLSVLGADAVSPMTFGRRHGAVENRLKASGLAWTMLQPINFAQQLLFQVAGQVKQQGAFFDPLGEAAVAYVDVRDNAAVAAIALTEPGHEGQSYPLTGPEALTGAQIAQTLTTITGRLVRYQAISLDEFKQGALQMGLPEAIAEPLRDLYALLQTGAGATVSDSVTRVTGKPARRFEALAREQADTLLSSSNGGQNQAVALTDRDTSGKVTSFRLYTDTAPLFA